MPADDALQALVRPVIVLGTGGTISMQGPRATPALDAERLIEATPVLAAVPSLSAETVLALTSSHMSLGEALAVSRHAAALASDGNGVVIATGTDTLEELAVLCALGYRGEAPI